MLELGSCLALPCHAMPSHGKSHWRLSFFLLVFEVSLDNPSPSSISWVAEFAYCLVSWAWNFQTTLEAFEVGNSQPLFEHNLEETRNERETKSWISLNFPGKMKKNKLQFLQS